MKATVVVIDMQPYFIVAKQALPGVRRLLKFANERSLPVVFVEWEGIGGTYGSLKKLAPAATYVYKYGRDGSKELNEALMRNMFSRNLIVGGVNTFVCVRETISGCFKQSVADEITIVASACACHPEEPSPDPRVLLKRREFRKKKLRVVEDATEFVMT